MDHMNSFQVPLTRVSNCMAWNYLEYDTSIPSIVEGRVHPIQFSNCVKRINVAARTHRDKNLFLLIMFVLGLLVIAAYPFVDTTYYMYLLLLFVPICIVEYLVFCYMKYKTKQLLKGAVEQENEVFVSNGMRLIWQEKTKQIVVEVVRRVSLSYENPVLVVQSLAQSGKLEKRPSSTVLDSEWRPLGRSNKSINQEKEPLLISKEELSDVLNPPHVQIPVE